MQDPKETTVAELLAPVPRYIAPRDRANPRRQRPVAQLPFMPALPRYVRGATSRYTPGEKGKR